MKKSYNNGNKKVCKSFEGKNHTDESRNKISKSMKGKGIGSENSQFGTIWITNGEQNKKINKDERIPLNWYKGRK